MARCNLRKKHETEREKKKDRVFKGMSNSELSNEVNDQSFDTNLMSMDGRVGLGTVQ